MPKNVGITGGGLVTPLGRSPREVLGRIGRGEVVEGETGESGLNILDEGS